MRSPRVTLLAALLLAALAPAADAGIWVTGYYPGWRQRHLPPEKIDFGALTHLVHFAVVPRPDGTLDSSVDLLTPENRRAAVAAAHAAGRKILVAVGGQATRERFRGAMRPGSRRAFARRVAEFARENGYDGVDVDMEEIEPEDAEDYAAFIRALRRELDRVSPRPLLTAAALWQAPLFARLAPHFDQINVMTYNVSGPYPGWVSWHNAPLFDGGARFPDGKALPSLDGLVRSFLDAGVPPGKLGAGASFIGSVWAGGVSGPGQAWSDAPTVSAVPYFVLASRYGLEEPGRAGVAYRWDERAQAPYLSVEGPGGRREFVSFGDAASLERTVEYVRRRGLGGLIIWDIAAGYRPDRPEGRRDLLLQAVKKARLSAEAMP